MFFTRIKTTSPNPLPALNSTSYNTRMRCCVASGVLRKSEVKTSIWMYIGMETFWQYIVKGSILILAVWIDIASRKRKTS